MTQTVTHSLDAKYYTDPEIFRIEQDGLYWRVHGSLQFTVRNWKMLGDYFAFEMAGESLFCIKGRDDGSSAHFTTSASTARINWSAGTGTTRVSWCAPITRGPMN